MARIIDPYQGTREEATSLARSEEIGFEALKKKYTEEDTDNPMSKKILQTVEEGIEEMEITEMQDYYDFFTDEEDGEFEVNPDTGVMTKNEFDEIQKSLGELAEENNEEAEKYQEEAIEKEKENKIANLDEFKDDKPEDRFLFDNFVQKAGKTLEKVKVGDSSSGMSRSTIDESDFVRSNESSVSDAFSNDNSSMFKQSESGPNRDFSRPAAPSRSYASSTVSAPSSDKEQVYDKDAREKEIGYMFETGARSAQSLAYSAPTKKSDRDTKDAHEFGGKKRLSFKRICRKTRRWLRSNESKLITKVGAMLALETGLAVITKRFKFDNFGQAIGFMGMALGMFYVSREIRSEGMDVRKMSFF